MTLVAIVIVILIVVGVAAYYLTQNTTSTTVNVHIQDDAACGLNDAGCLFSPASYTATLNGAVVWKNDGTVGHTVATNATLNGNLPTFASPSTLGHGQTYSFTFATAGTYHYYCTIHPWMKGTVVAA